MKPNRQAVLYYGIALISIAAAVSWLTKEDGTKSGLIWLGVGVFNLLLGTLWLNKARTLKAEAVEAYNESVNAQNEEDYLDEIDEIEQIEAAIEDMDDDFK